VAAERLPTDQGPGNRTVDVEVADIERLTRQLDMPGTTRVESSGQCVGGAVGELERLFERRSPHHGQHRAEDFFLRQPVSRLNVCDDYRSHGITRAFHRAIDHDPAFASPDLQILPNPLLRPPVDHRTKLGSRILSRSDAKTHHRIGQPLDKRIVNRIQENHT